MTRIAVDAMGGDHAPFEIVAGAVWAAAEYGVAIELVGKQDRIESCLEQIEKEGFLSECGKAGRKRRVHVDIKSLDIKITHASEIIDMGEAPGQAIRKKKNSSIVLKPSFSSRYLIIFFATTTLIPGNFAISSSVAEFISIFLIGSVNCSCC